MTKNLFLRSLLVILKRDLHEQYRNLTWMVMLFLYFLTGVFFTGATLTNLVSLKDYLSFISVGLLVLGIYNTSYFYMNVVSREIRRGYIKYLLVLPLNRLGLALARLITGATLGITFAAMLMCFNLFLAGVPDFSGFILILVAIAVMALFLSGLGISVAIFLKPEVVDPVSDLIGLGSVFFSTLYYPEYLMPEPIKLISMFNPFSASSNLIRAGFGQHVFSLLDIIVLATFATFFASLSVVGYHRKLEEF